MERYLIRTVKYMIYLVIFMVIIVAAMNALGATKLSLAQIVTTDRSLWLIAIVFAFALLYPFFGFVKKSIVFDASKRVEDVDRVMGMCGYICIENQDQGSVLIYRASSSLKRLTLIYEDMITITTVGGLSVMSGPRKEVVKASFRMTTFVQ